MLGLRLFALCHKNVQNMEPVQNCMCSIVCAFSKHKHILISSLILIDSIIYVPLTSFQIYREGSSWVEPVLSYNYQVSK